MKFQTKCYNEFMIRLLSNILIFLFFFFALFQANPIYAQTAYDDYINALDEYRIVLSEFKIAKNEYDKFGTLTSKQDALNKAKAYLITRDKLLISYLTYVSMKVRDTASMSESSRQTNIKLIENELIFLRTHLALASSISSISDSIEVSKQLESHYHIVQTSIRQILIEIASANLDSHAVKIEKLHRDITAFISVNRSGYDQETLSLSDRWSLSIENKLRLYRQKTTNAGSSLLTLESDSLEELNTQTALIMSSLGEAKADLTEAVSYMSELITVLKYKR